MNDAKDKLLAALELVKTGRLQKPLVFDGDALIKLKQDRERMNAMTFSEIETEEVQADALPAPENRRRRPDRLPQAVAALTKKLDEISASIRRHRQNLTHLSKDAERAPPSKRALVEQMLEAEKHAIEQLQDEFDKANAHVNTLQGHLIQLAESDNSIEIVVGYVAYPTLTKGQVPIYPIIELWFKDSTLIPALRDWFPPRLLLSTDDLRYKIYEPGCEDTPLAFCDEPITPHMHKMFQMLTKHWGHWFLRMHSPTLHWDFQVMHDGKHDQNGTVFRLEHPIETSLGVISTPPEQVVAEAVQELKRGDERHVRDMLKRFEKLVGPLPVPRGGHHPLTLPEGKLFAWVVNNARTSSWVTLDQKDLGKQVQKIIGGSFRAVIWEEMRPGVDLLQAQGTEKHGPEIWFRARPDTKRRPLYTHRHANADERAVAEQLKASTTVEKFDDGQVLTLCDDDIPSVLKLYKDPNQPKHDAPIVPDDNVAAVEVDKTMHEEIITNFLLISQTLRLEASAGQEFASVIWPFLRNAILFEMPPVAYLTLYNEFFRFIARLAKVDVNVPLTAYTPKQLKRVYGILATGEDAPFPEKMPFPACFFAYGGGVTDPSANLFSAELTAQHAETRNVGKLYGHLVTATGMVVSFRYILDPATGRKGIVTTFDRKPDVTHKWDRVQTLAPWIINALIEYVNEHKSIIEQGKNGLAHQMLVKKVSKELRIKAPTPPPFYVVRMKDQLIREQAQKHGASIKRHIEWQHRWNVRGHDCIRFARGQLPLEETAEADFIARGYKVFKGEDIVDSTMFNALNRRGVAPKRNDEWMAILSYWRESFIKGPEGKPLVESTRQSEKKWDRWVDWNAIDVKPDET